MGPGAEAGTTRVKLRSRKAVIASASEAIHEMQRKSWTCFVASLLAMTLRARSSPNTTPHSRDSMRPSFANSSALKRKRAHATLKRGRGRSQEGRREDRVRAAPAVACAKVDRKTHTSIQVQRKQSGLPCAMVLTVYFVLSPARPDLFVTVAPQKRELLKNLMPATGASGPHDLTVRVTRCSSKAHPRPSLPAPTSETMANAPLSGRDGARSEADLPSRSSSTAATRWHDGQINECAVKVYLLA
jgi:hypothetical protein